MRIVKVTALAAAAGLLVALATPADAQQRRGYRAQTERITIIDETGRVRTKITVRPRSYLDGGTEVLPGERKFMDYALPPGYQPMGSVVNTGGKIGGDNSPLPGPFDLPSRRNPMGW